MSRDSLDFGCGITVFIIGCVAALVLLFAAVAFLIEQTSLPGDLAQIEQLRADSKDLDPTQAEDVIGQITMWNQSIRQKQTLNDQWWAAIIIPDEWDDVKLIPVPRQP